MPVIGRHTGHGVEHLHLFIDFAQKFLGQFAVTVTVADHALVPE